MSVSAGSASDGGVLTMAAVAPFGTDRNGNAVSRIAIGNGRLTAWILTFGAVIQDLRLSGHPHPLTLGFEHFADYRDRALYFGAVVGRHANRIRDGRFALDGTTHAIEPAHPERHGLHGGSEGYAHRNWTLVEATALSVTLSLRDPDGAMGFPGTLDVRCTYSIEAPATLVASLSATGDRATLCNLAQHAYFNLDDGGQGTILDHRLTIEADRYLPVDGQLIPDGPPLPVEGTPYDFRRTRTVRQGSSASPFRYDTNYCLSSSRRALARAARLEGATSGVSMELWTTEPGLQFYSGHLTPEHTPGLEGRRHGPFSGLCLEAQVWPDSPNRPDFPQAVLRPGEVYRQRTEFRFGSQ